MTLGESLADVARALGALERNVHELNGKVDTLQGDVNTLNDAAKLAAGIAMNRRKAYARLTAVLVGLASLTTAGTAAVSYYANTTHPASKPTTTVIVHP